MVNGRGGLEKISKEFVSGKSANTFVAWHVSCLLHDIEHPTNVHARRTDTCVSIALNIRPRFELVQNEEEKGDDNWTPYTALARRYQSKLNNLTGHEELSAECIHIYSTLRNVPPLPEPDALAMIQKGNSTPVSKYKGQLERLERRALALILSASEAPDQDQSLQIYQLFGNASLIHALLFMRNSPASIPLSRLLSDRIQKLLTTIDIQTYLLQYPEMLLWILIMGGFGAASTSTQQVFATILAESCLALGLVGIGEIALTLEDFLWNEAYCSPTTLAFWSAVAAEQGVEEKSVVLSNRSMTQG